MIKIGVSSASLYPEELSDSLRVIGEQGIQNTEIFLNTISEMSPDFIEELCRIKTSYGTNIVSFHPFTSGYESYLFARNYPRRYKDTFDFYQKFFYITAQLGAKIFVLHGDKKKPSNNVYEYCEHFNKLSQLAEREGVILTQENVNLFAASNPDFIRDMVKILGNRAMFTFDVKQAIRSGYDVWDVYDAMRGHIAHMHLSDSTPEKDCLLPGNGTFPFEKLFRIAQSDGYDGAALIEVYSGAFSSYEQLSKSCNLLKQKYESVL